MQRENRNGEACGNANPIVMEMLHGIATQLEVIETVQRRGQHVEDVSDDEEEEVAREQGENPLVNDSDEERFIRAFSTENTKPHFTPLDYDGKWDLNELLDWIMKMEKYFILKVL